MTELRLHDVAVAYGARTALADLELTVASAERVAVLGPNGAGKSSLLRCISGIVPVSRGMVTLDGVPLAELGREAIARRIAVVPQQVDLPFAIRVEEVVALGRIPHERSFRGPTAHDRQIVGEAIQRVGLDGFVGRDARELSLGERQLVLIAMAVAQQARLLLLDEPTVHLDLRHQVQVMDLMADLNDREGLTIVAVLHDLALAAHYFPRAVLLDGGRLVGDGPPAQVLAPDRVRATFGVDAAVWMGGARPGV
ncbi:MAG TPA: ABC transporter ATP-binding protein [Candidatus Sulfotelmatobacter sp.]|nr:ABC transporter ATP-binding protein [Candidatus Sulfotelmatobacter sp.]